MSAQVVADPGLPSYLLLQLLLFKFKSRADAGDPGKQDAFIIVIIAPSTTVVINTLHPGYSLWEVKLFTWGGAKDILGKKVHCHYKTIETKWG